MPIEEVLILAFAVALVVFVVTRLNSGLTREQRERLTSTKSES
jgi:hypothetical protein